MPVTWKDLIQRNIIKAGYMTSAYGVYLLLDLFEVRSVIGKRLALPQKKEKKRDRFIYC
jgi:hypothetical protein